MLSFHYPTELNSSHSVTTKHYKPFYWLSFLIREQLRRLNFIGTAGVPCQSTTTILRLYYNFKEPLNTQELRAKTMTIETLTLVHTGRSKPVKGPRQSSQCLQDLWTVALVVLLCRAMATESSKQHI